MWGRSVSLVLVLAVVLAAALPSLARAGQPSSSPLTPGEACFAHRVAESGVAPEATGPVNPLSQTGCPVPTGGVLDPCSAATAGTVSCPFYTPDLNPADWAGWLGCEILAQANAIWTAIYSSFVSAIVGLVSGLGNLVVGAMNTVLNAGSAVVQSGAGTISSGVSGVTQFVSSTATSTGPFAPIVTVGLWLLLVIVGLVILYFTAVGIIALARTFFNLL